MMVGVGCGAPRGPSNACTGDECLDANETLVFCSHDSECSADQYCAGGTCQPRSGGRPDDSCSTHNDCSVGRYCNILTGRCVDCLNEDHCELGLICRDDGTCGDDSGCSSNFDCGGLVCDTTSGNCVQCLTSADCPMGQTCRDEQCVTSDGGDPQCNTQADCDPYGRICDMATGRCLPCTSDVECGAGKICSAGTCTIDGGGGGGGGGGDGSCSSRDECTPQACNILVGMCMPCIMDFDCFDISDIFTGVVMICDPMTGNCVDPECSSANDCPPGEACYDGHCGTCLYDDECRAGEVCNTSTGVCEGGGGGGDCASHTDCPAGQFCDVGAGDCVACLNDDHCNSGDVCQGGVCVPDTPTGCTGDGDCPGGYCEMGSGVCVACLLDAHCGTGFACQSNGCVPVSTGNGAFGESCAAQTDCDAGLLCLGDGTTGICSRTCIGSGAGGDADCPNGFACYNYESGSLDGLKMCNGASQLPASTPGQPFDQAPGTSCASHNGCQTGTCNSSQMCARSCSANRDCDAGEVCYAINNEHFCYYSDISEYQAVGESCSSDVQCDSGVCKGECGSGSACNSSSNCGLFDSCSGTCRDHCRSNSDCSISEACNPWPMNVASASGWIMVCTAKYFDGSQSDGTTCTDDGECASDWCVSGLCTTPCAISADCTGPLAGKSCTPRSFSDSNGDAIYSFSFCL